MKYTSFDLAGREFAGVVDGESIVPFSDNFTVRQILQMGQAGTAFARQTLAAGVGRVKLSNVKLLPPVTNPDKVMCVGLNYRDHAEHSGAPIPKVPLIFNKFGSSLCAANAPIRQVVTDPKKQCLDWEIEQIVVVGKRAVCVSEADAWDYIGGYMTGNDVSERLWQLGTMNQSPVGPQWTFGKGFDTSGVCGPYLVTSDECSPEQSMNMDVKCWYNGELVQSSNTKMHIFTAAQVLAHISNLITLLPGDLIYMGTPAGTAVEGAKEAGGLGKVKWMRPGGVLRSEVGDLGVCENTILSNADHPNSKL